VQPNPVKLQNSTVTSASTLSRPVCRYNFTYRTDASRAAVANDGHNRPVRSADCVCYGLNSLFREIVFPVLRNHIPCSGQKNSLLARPGIGRKTPEFRRSPAKTGPNRSPEKAISREKTPITGNFCGKMRPRAPNRTTAAKSRPDRLPNRMRVALSRGGARWVIINADWYWQRSSRNKEAEGDAGKADQTLSKGAICQEKH
jgi:hypothetical protein